MNINDLKEAVKNGMVSTLNGLILAYEAYGEATDQNVAAQVTALRNEINSVEGL